jgi:hypothetical protein
LRSRRAVDRAGLHEAGHQGRLLVGVGSGRGLLWGRRRLALNPAQNTGKDYCPSQQAQPVIDPPPCLAIYLLD